MPEDLTIGVDIGGTKVAARTGKVPETIAFIIQWVKLPRLCPLARTRVGKTSLR